MEIVAVYTLTFLLAWPLGRYMSKIFHSEHTFFDRIFGPIENLIYRLLKIDPNRGMDWRGYAKAILWSNLPIALIAYLIFIWQKALPLNPDGIGPMNWHTALHTVASFITNTNQQHYSGQAQLSYLSQMIAVTAMQIITPAVGIAALVAVLRGFLSKTGNLGNYYADVTRAITRILLPLSFVLAIFLVWQGVPSTFSGAKTVQTLEKTTQTIPVGPVAAMVAIKQLGTNGGGWYGPNSAVPLENPTPLSNLFEMIAILLIPVSCIFMVGYFLRRMRFALMVLAVMSVLSLALTAWIIPSANQPNAAFAGLAINGPNLEGVETRFGPTSSALWATLTTQTSNGSVNQMHDSLNPIAGLVPFIGMWTNLIFGGDGVGFLNFFIYLIIAVFVAGLMVGRTPELFGRKIEAREMKLASLALLISPLLTLLPAAIALAIPSITGNSNPGFHGLSQVVYEYTSAVANNGSGFEGLGDGSVWWNLSTSFCLILARFIPIIAPLAIAGSLSKKKIIPESSGTLRVDTPIFAGTTLSVILIVGALSYFPVAVLGPISEQLTLGQKIPKPISLGSDLDSTKIKSNYGFNSNLEKNKIILARNEYAN